MQRNAVGRASGVAVGCIALVLGVAEAKESPASVVAAEAAKHEKAGEFAKAAATYARAAVAAHGARDLDSEQVASDGLESSLGRAKGEERQAALAGALKVLDAKRAGGLVAARGLALGIFFEATVSGNPTGVAEAADAVAASSKIGKAGPILAGYGAAMRSASKEKGEAAAQALRKAADDAFAQRFDDVAFFAAVEAGAVRLALGDVKAAREDFARAARVFADGSDAWMKNAWNRAQARFADDAPEALEPLKEATQAPNVAGGRGGAGGRGADGADAGRRQLSKVGQAVEGGGKKPVAWVKRAAREWEAGTVWEKEPRKAPFEDGFRNVEDGGLLWVVSGRSHTATVAQIDRTGTRGGPGESSVPPIARPRWHLVDGETIHLLPDGTVQIK